MRTALNDTFVVTTPWMADAPTRSGWYIASTERNPSMRAHWCGTTWSAQVDEADSAAALDVARATPMDPEHARRIEWCGITADSHAWLAAELSRGAAAAA